jgi:RNA polymerase sigma factor (sigma-70 family)
METLGAALRQLNRLFAGGVLAASSDAELLERFLTQGDAGAFGALVERHGPMVLGVCRRVLRDSHDAEDAFQATFLVLVRRGNAIRGRGALAGWLHQVAHRIAIRASIAAARRRKLERQVEQMVAVGRTNDPPAPDDELRVLDEEIGRLPEKYRLAIVLCDLQGMTQERAAEELRWSKRTLQLRLSEARARLRRRLTRRGLVSQDATASALLALQARAPVPAACLDATVRAAVAMANSTLAAGGVSATVQQMVRTEWKSMLIHRFTSVSAALVASGLVAWGSLAVLSSHGQEAPRSTSRSPTAARRKAEAANANGPNRSADRGKEVILKGKVFGVDGKAFAGAKVCLRGKEGRSVNLGVTAADGRFTAIIPESRGEVYLLAQAEGYGLDFIDLRETDVAAEASLHLVPDHPIRGRVLSTQGQPVAGVQVRVNGIEVYANGSLDPFLDGWKKWGSMTSKLSGVKNLPGVAEALFPATTDAEGRFTLRGIGAERVVDLRFGGAGIAEAECVVVNRVNFDPKPYNEATLVDVPKIVMSFAALPLLYGPDPNVVAEAEKPIRGVVRAADTGKGLAGVEVWITRDGDHILRFPLKATTDASGRYQLHGARKAKDYMVEVKADADAGYMPSQASAADTAGYEPLTVDLRMSKGVIVTGRLFDRSTGKGVPGRVMAGVLNENPFAKDYPELNSAISLPMRETAADGSFRIVTIPGPVLLMGGPSDEEAIYRYKQVTPDPNYPQYFPKEGLEGTYLGLGGDDTVLQGNSCKVLEVRPATEVVRSDIGLELATSLPLQLRDADGKPLTGVWVAGTTSRDSYPARECKTDVCAAYDVEAGKSRLLVFVEPGRKLAASLTLNGGEKSPVVVTLRPTGAAKGRLVDPNGKPLTGVTVNLNYKDRPAVEIKKIASQARQVVTDADGSFAVDTILPGLPYALSFTRQGKQLDLTTKPAVPFSVGSGDTRDLGSFTVKAEDESADE